MEMWFVITVTLCTAALLNATLTSISRSKSNKRLPPGPTGVPILSSLTWTRKSTTELETGLRAICSKFGPIVTLRFSSRLAIFVCSRTLAHEALVQKGAIFADRPKPLPTAKIASSNQHNITSAGYGPTWRILRRNLTAEILHPSKAKDFCHARKWVLDILVDNLRDSAASESQGIKVMDHFHYAMFCLLVFMCFGDKLDEPKIREIESIQHRVLTSFRRFQILNFLPSVTRILMRSRWNEFFAMMRKQEEVLIPRIRARQQLQQQGRISDDENSRLVTSYADSLFKLELPEDGKNGNTKRKLSEAELVTACSEFLNAGTDTTSTALEWIMANIVKSRDIQDKLFQEIKRVIGDQAKEVGEDKLSQMPYLKAVVLEGLRRHPPAHFVLQHAVTQEVELGGYIIPKSAIINFTVAEMGWDPEVWEDPMRFKPERFLSNQEEFDITGSREIKMMPFGVGRRICPAYGLAMLHLEYFVANLVWKFVWKAPFGYEVDFTERQVFTTVMKHPLQACISPRPK